MPIFLYKNTANQKARRDVVEMTGVEPVSENKSAVASTGLGNG